MSLSFTPNSSRAGQRMLGVVIGPTGETGPAGEWTTEDTADFILGTKTDVELVTVPEDIEAIRTTGYTNPGDGGGALYLRAVAEPSHPGWFQDNGNAYWELAEGQIVETKTFGAACDDTTNDHDAVQDFFDFMSIRGGIGRISEGTSVLAGASRVSVADGTVPFTIDGYGDTSVLKRGAGYEWTLTINRTDGVTLKNFKLDGNGVNFPANPGPVLDTDECSDLTIENITVINTTTSGGISCRGANRQSSTPVDPNTDYNNVVKKCRVYGDTRCNNGIVLISLGDSGVQDCYVEGCQGSPGWAIELKSGAANNWIINNTATTSNRGIGCATDDAAVPDEDEDDVPDYGVYNARIIGNTSYNNVDTNYHLGRLEDSIFSDNISDGMDVCTGITFSTACKNITGTGNYIRNIASGELAINTNETTNIHLEFALENVVANCISSDTGDLNNTFVVTNIIDGPDPQDLWENVTIATNRNCHIYVTGVGQHLGWYEMTAAATTSILNSPSEDISLGGVTTVTSLGDGPVGTRRRIYCEEATPFTYAEATLALPNAQNYTATAGDILLAEVIDTEDKWVVRVLHSGTHPVALGGTGAATARAAAANLAVPYTLAHSAVGVSHTGNTNETALATIAVPANAMGANGMVRVTTIWTVTNDASVKTARVRFGGVSGTEYCSKDLASIDTFVNQVSVENRNATNSQLGRPLGAGNSAASSAGWSGSSTAVVTSAVDTTAAVDIVISGQLGDGTDTIRLESYLVELIRP
jgi:hypothetical protein